MRDRVKDVLMLCKGSAIYFLTISLNYLIVIFTKRQILINKISYPITNPKILTRYLNKKKKAYTKSREPANASNLANRRAKFAFLTQLYVVQCTVAIFHLNSNQV